MAFIGNLNQKMDALPERTYEPIPEGWYQAIIKSCDVEKTKNGGTMLKLRFDISGPTHPGAVVWTNLNIVNSNENTEMYALQDLKSIKAAVGKPGAQDTDELIGVPIEVKVKIKPAENGYDARNEVKGYRAIKETAIPSVSQPAFGKPAYPQQAQQAQQRTPPFMAKPTPTPAQVVSPVPSQTQDDDFPLF